MLDRKIVRFGAGAIMAGSVLALVFNVLHPRSDDVDRVGEEIRLAGDKGIWVFDHYMLAWAVALAFIGLVVVGRSFSDEPARSLGRVALAAAIGATAILLATVVVDGAVSKQVAEDLKEGLVGPETAFAVSYVGLGLFMTAIGSFFGIVPILFGGAMLLGNDYPKWLGYLAVAAGALGLLTSSIMFFSGVENFTANVLFPISSIGFTVWAFFTGWQLWTKTEVTAAVPAPVA